MSVDTWYASRMAWVDLLWLSFAIAFGAAGLLLLVWSLFCDRAKGRPRCPRCWYDLSGLNGRRCPECGIEAKKDRHLYRTRRHWKAAALAMVLLILAAVCIGTQQVRKHGWAGAGPSWAYILLLPHLDNTTTMIELSRRIDEGELRQ